MAAITLSPTTNGFGANAIDATSISFSCEVALAVAAKSRPSSVYFENTRAPFTHTATPSSCSTLRSAPITGSPSAITLRK
jgi:hypothetical protein